jgi:energy coupling factor transporter S component ThiW
LNAALIRNASGTGTIFAFPGGIPGAVVAGLVYRQVRRDWAALLEPVGTGVIGVLVIILILGPVMGKEFAFFLFFPAFMISSIPGSILGYPLLKTLRRKKVLESYKFLESDPPPDWVNPDLKAAPTTFSFFFPLPPLP